MQGRGIALALLIVVAAATSASGGGTVIGLAPGSPSTCATASIDVCSPGGDVFASYPQPAPVPAPPIYLFLLPGDVVTSYSMGTDRFDDPASLIRFSVDAATVGVAGDVVAQAAAGEAAADVYTAGTFGAPAVNVLTADGDGLPAAAAPALGLAEASGGVGPHDDLDVLATCSRNGAPFFTLAAGSPTLAMLGASPADILIGFDGDAYVIASPATLGLMAGDAIDALAYHLGIPSARFSLAPGSPTLALIGAGPADILAPGPTVAVPASALGLGPADNIDALDISLDADADLVTTQCDNCPTAVNPTQSDADADGFGDACDTCTDRDGDGIGDPGFPLNVCLSTDNCPLAANPDQADADGDGVGDACDACPLGDDAADDDDDGIADACDSCPGSDDADPANPCPTLFGLEYDASKLRIYNPHTRAVLHTTALTLPGAVLTYGRGLAFAPVTGQLYGLVEIDGQVGVELVTIDRLSGAMARIGNTGDFFWGLTADCAGTLYGVVHDDHNPGPLPQEALFTLDKATGAPTLVRVLGNGDVGEAIAYRPIDKRIYHASGNATRIFESVALPGLAITDIPLIGNAGYVHAMVYWEAADLFLTAYGYSNVASTITPGGVATLLPGRWGPANPPYAFPFAFAFSGQSPACAAACPPAPSLTCSAAPKSTLLVKDASGAGAGDGDRLLWKWLNGPALPQTDFGDPTVGADYAMCLYAGASPTLRLEAAVAAGGTCGDVPCWMSFGGMGYRYVDGVPAATGITRMTLKGAAVAGRSKILLKGRDAGLALTVDTLPLDGASDVIVQLVNGDNANCWSATFPPASVRTNSDVLFKARTP